jgi:hypothetical protein
MLNERDRWFTPGATVVYYRAIEKHMLNERDRWFTPGATVVYCRAKEKHMLKTVAPGVNHLSLSFNMCFSIALQYTTVAPGVNHLSLI